MKRATRFAEFKKQLGNNFNPRPREEGDKRKLRCRANRGNFNPRPREEGDSFHCLYYNVPLYFNPRPREEGDGLSLGLGREEAISIHALVKRATYGKRVVKVLHDHFNPRPREEGDTKFIIRLYTILNFNPRPREEGDGRKRTSIRQMVYFNPRPREEGDRTGMQIFRICTIFQSTPS